MNVDTLTLFSLLSRSKSMIMLCWKEGMDSGPSIAAFNSHSPIMPSPSASSSLMISFMSRSCLTRVS